MGRTARRSAARAASFHAVVVQIGLFGRDIDLPFDLVCLKQLDVSSGLASTPTSWGRALGLIESATIELEPLVSHVLALDDWQEAFELARTGRGVKVVLDPRL